MSGSNEGSRFMDDVLWWDFNFLTRDETFWSALSDFYKRQGLSDYFFNIRNSPTPNQLKSNKFQLLFTEVFVRYYLDFLYIALALFDRRSAALNFKHLLVHLEFCGTFPLEENNLLPEPVKQSVSEGFFDSLVLWFIWVNSIFENPGLVESHRNLMKVPLPQFCLAKNHNKWLPLEFYNPREKPIK